MLCYNASRKLIVRDDIQVSYLAWDHAGANGLASGKKSKGPIPLPGTVKLIKSPDNKDMSNDILPALEQWEDLEFFEHTCEAHNLKFLTEGNVTWPVGAALLKVHYILHRTQNPDP